MGKSALLRLLVNHYPPSAGSVLILDVSNTFEDLESERVSVENPGRRNIQSWIDDVTGEGEGPRNGGFGPGLLVLDDADRYLSYSSFDGFRDVWLANRHLGLDVAVSAHRPQGVPKELLGATSELWLFAQEEAGAIEYLARMPTLRATFRDHDAPLPTEAGVALRVVPAQRSIQTVRIFK